jgi:alkylated DNA repair dioxygenase AlkB
MSILFPEDSFIPVIPGLTYSPRFISPEEERELVEAIDREPWDESWDRRRQPYGAPYGREGRAAPPIPSWGKALASKIFDSGNSPYQFDQMLVNEYLPGQGIAMHCDYEPFDDTVVSISLLSPCVMEFRRLTDSCHERLLLEPRSLLVLANEARYQWQHGIASRKNDRWQGEVIPRRRRLSVTFRRLKAAS